jgi:ferrous iron transport protein A
MTLDQAQENKAYRIVSLKNEPSSAVMSDRNRQLLELGFIKGEEVILLRRTQPGSDPLVVRVGASTFALRKIEAGSIKIEHV